MAEIPNRILSLDVFRGLTILLMILVNSQGIHSYPLLIHVDWNGCTLADLVFPSFLFIVGLTSVITLSKQFKLQDKDRLYKSIMRRSIILFCLGLFINIFPSPLSISSIRFFGILQRIALCYLISAFIYLNTSLRTQALIYFGILIGYWFIMTQIPVPGFGVNQLTPEGSWVSYFDQLIFSSGHLFEKTYDPEGFFSTFPSIATTLFGVIIGQLLLSTLGKKEQLYWMLLLGILSLVLGWFWGYSFPINKNIWTSSFVLWTSGFSLIVFASCFLLIDILGYQKWTLPFKIFGTNALFIFVVHVLLLKLQFACTFKSADGTLINLRTAITYYLFPEFSPANAALLYGISFLVLNFILVSFLYKRKIFIRI